MKCFCWRYWIPFNWLNIFCRLEWQKEVGKTMAGFWLRQHVVIKTTISHCADQIFASMDKSNKLMLKRADGILGGFKKQSIYITAARTTKKYCPFFWCVWIRCLWQCIFVVCVSLGTFSRRSNKYNCCKKPFHTLAENGFLFLCLNRLVHIHGKCLISTMECFVFFSTFQLNYPICRLENAKTDW